jgi:hypothetical protein
MKVKTNIISIVLFISIFTIFVFCKKQKAEWTGAIEEVGGVTVVKNPKEPIYEEDVFGLDEELTIGEEDKDGEPLFIDISSVRVDYEENIYVLDSKACQIKVFDKNGKYLRKIGRKGRGPGEMQLPTVLDIVSGKEIMICDLPNNRISFYSLQGELLKEVSKGKFFRLWAPIPDSNRGFVGSTRIQIEEKRIDELMKFDSNFKPIFTIDKIEYIDEPNVIYPYPPFIFYIILKDNKVLWGNWVHYRLQIADDAGRTTRKIIKDYDPLKITDEDKERDIKERFGGRGIPPDIKLVFPDYYPAFWHLSNDDEGRIFAQTFRRTEEDSYYYDVFDSDGKYIAKVPLKARPQAWKNNKLYTIEENEEGYQYVRRYKVIWRY